MKYISTRGKAEKANFEDVLLKGLAPDGGLYLPETLPTFTLQEIASWKSLSYPELAFKVMQPFVEGSIDDDAFKSMINECYANFDHKDVAPLIKLSSSESSAYQYLNNEYILELFHGPTLAFKDFALQLLGRVLDAVLEKRDEKAVIMGATSGDTGSAAIEGCRACERVEIFILHPHNRVSEVQRRQMTTVLTNNVHNIAIEGNFDDCQSMVKESFKNQSFLKGEKRLIAVNSINWARIMAQIVYYFHAALQLDVLDDPENKISFSVPTGNFGDIFAGYIAKKMGLPIDRLVIATNANDILHRFISENNYSQSELVHTLSPSMDILVSSNFERFLFDVFNQDSEALTEFMEKLSTEDVSVDEEQMAFARSLFLSARANDEETCEVIKQVYASDHYLLDPHTAIGVKASRECLKDHPYPIVNLATAHPVKFSQAIEKAGIEKPDLPEHLSDLLEREEAYTVLKNDIKEVQSYICEKGL
jgi:threonine synthase